MNRVSENHWVIGRKQTIKPRPPLNIVLVSKKFSSLKEFSEFVKTMLSSKEFNSREPHYFLFSEDAFTKSIPKRSEVKKTIQELRKFLAEEHRKSVIAFSIIEETRLTQSSHGEKKQTAIPLHTGYVVSSKKYEVNPKLNLAYSDFQVFGSKYLNKNIEESESNAMERLWERIEGVFRKRGFATTLIGGKKVEHRVCADAGEKTPFDRRTITVVSAKRLPSYEETGAALSRNITFINDSEARHGGRRMVLRIGGINSRISLEPGFYTREKRLRKAIERRITKMGLRIHLYNG